MNTKNGISWTTLDYLERWVPLGSYYFLIGTVVALGGILGLSLVTKNVVKVESAGKINSEQRPVPIKTSGEFIVDNIYVKENSYVKKGAPLVSSKDNLTPQQVHAIETYRRLLTGICAKLHSNLRCSNCLKEINQASNIFSSFSQQLDVTEILTASQMTANELRKLLEENQGMGVQTADVAHNITVTTQKINSIKAQHAEKILAHEYEQLMQDLISLKTRMKSREQDSRLNIGRTVGQLETQLSDMRSRIDKKGRNYVLTAPFNGITSSIKVKGRGEALSPGEVVMELIPAGSKLVAELDVSAKDIALVKQGMDATLTFDAFPEAEYGSVRGTVVSIDRFDVQTQAAQTQSTFKAIVQLESQELEADGKSYPYVIGMTLRGKVIIRHETIFHTAMNQLFHIGNSL